MSDRCNWTPTQRRLLAVLADGEWHSAVELHECLEDDLAGPTALRFHLSTIRTKLGQRGEGIATTCVGGKGYHQHVRLIAGADE